MKTGRILGIIIYLMNHDNVSASYLAERFHVSVRTIHNSNSAEVNDDFLCKFLIEANAGKVERAIEEAASRCAEESEYIAASEEMEIDAPEEETVNIRRRRAR